MAMANHNRKIPSNATSTRSASPPAPPRTVRKAGRAEAGVTAMRIETVHEDIDESAERFIKRFRENLLLQRLESIENYKQMLARGV